MSDFDRPHRLYLPPLETTDIRLLLLIGLPGSGKSSLASELVQLCPQRSLISTDTIRSQLFGNEAIQGDWLTVWREVGRQLRQSVQQIGGGQFAETVYDATNAVRRDRRRVLALARTYGFTNIIGIWVNTPLEICLQRNQQRDRRVPDAVILQMHRRLLGAPPAIEDGCDQVLEIGG